MKKEYNKPEVKIEKIITDSAIADTCWGLTENHKQQKTRYYDVDGVGFLSFNVKSQGNSCDAPDAYNIKYLKYEGDTGVDGSQYEAQLEEALSSKGGNNGQPYKGLDTDFPTSPSSSWS